MKPNGRDHTTDPVLKRLAGLDHDGLIFASHQQARGPDEAVYGDNPPVPSDPPPRIPVRARLRLLFYPIT